MKNSIDSLRHTTRAPSRLDARTDRRRSREIGFTVVGAGVIALAACSGELQVMHGADGGTTSTGGTNAAQGGYGAGGQSSTGGTTAGEGGTTTGPAGSGGETTNSAGNGGAINGGTGGTEGGESYGGSGSEPEHCSDHVFSGDETNVDCGGSCKACPQPTCECASSDSLVLLGCGSSLMERLRVGADGQAAAFELCFDDADGFTITCTPYYFTPDRGTIAIPGPSGGSVVQGMSEDGTLVLLRPYRERTKPELYDVSNDESTPLELHDSPLLLSAEGVVFGVTTPKAGKSTLTRVVAGVPETLGDLPTTRDRVYIEAATPDGNLVVGSIIRDDEYQPFRWSEATGLVVGLDGLPAATPNAAFMNVSRDGSTFSGFLYSGSELRSAFLWTEAGGVLELGASGQQPTSYSMLSNDGSVAVTALDTNTTETSAVRWTQSGGPVPLLPNAPNIATAMTPNGSLIFGQLYQKQHGYDAMPFVWTAESGARNLRELLEATDVDLTNLELSSPLGVSRDGKIAVGAGSCGDLTAIYRLEVPE